MARPQQAQGPRGGGPGAQGHVHPASPGRVSHCLLVQATQQARARCKQQAGRWQCGTWASDQDADGNIHSRASIRTGNPKQGTSSTEQHHDRARTPPHARETKLFISTEFCVYRHR